MTATTHEARASIRQHVPAATAHLVAADVLLLLTGMLQLGAGTDGETQSIDADSHERISMYIQVLSNSPELEQLCLVHCREAFNDAARAARR